MFTLRPSFPPFFIAYCKHMLLKCALIYQMLVVTMFSTREGFRFNILGVQFKFAIINNDIFFVLGHCC